MNKRTKSAYKDSAKLIIELRNGLCRKDAVNRVIHCESELRYAISDLKTIGKAASKARALLAALYDAYKAAR